MIQGSEETRSEGKSPQQEVCSVACLTSKEGESKTNGPTIKFMKSHQWSERLRTGKQVSGNLPTEKMKALKPTFSGSFNNLGGKKVVTHKPGTLLVTVEDTKM